MSRKSIRVREPVESSLEDDGCVTALFDMLQGVVQQLLLLE
jgi:hypothetical protein